MLLLGELDMWQDSDSQARRLKVPEKPVNSAPCVKIMEVRLLLYEQVEVGKFKLLHLVELCQVARPLQDAHFVVVVFQHCHRRFQPGREISKHKIL